MNVMMVIKDLEMDAEINAELNVVGSALVVTQSMRTFAPLYVEIGESLIESIAMMAT